MRKRALFAALLAISASFPSFAVTHSAGWFDEAVASGLSGWSGDTKEFVDSDTDYVEINADTFVDYTPTYSSAGKIVRQTTKFYTDVLTSLPGTSAADLGEGAQTGIALYTAGGTTNYIVCVKSGGETNWVALANGTPEANTWKTIAMEFDYRTANAPKVSFYEVNGGVDTLLSATNNNETVTSFDTLDSTKTAVSYTSFAGSGRVASLLGTQEGVYQVGSNYYMTIGEALAAVATDSVKTITLVNDSSENFTLPVGVTFNTGSATYNGTLSAPECYVIDNSGTSYTNAWDSTNYAQYSTFWSSDYTPSAGNSNISWQNFVLDIARTSAPSNKEDGPYFFVVNGNNVAETYSKVSLKSITVKWGDATHNQAQIGNSQVSEQPNAYIVVTSIDDNKIKGISSINSEKWSARGMSTFTFENTILDSSVTQRFWFVTSTAGCSVGDDFDIDSAVPARISGLYHWFTGVDSYDDGSLLHSGQTDGKYNVNFSAVVSPCVATVGGAPYATLTDAIAAAEVGTIKTVVLCAATTDAVTIPSGVIVDLNGFTVGAISGSGTVTASSQPATNAEPTFGEGWTGTFVVNWSVPSTQSGFNFNTYGREGSTVEIAKPWNNYQSKVKDRLTVNPAVKLSASMTMSNGYSGTGNCTTFSEVSGTGDINFTLSNANADLYYKITKLDNYTGKITLNNGASGKYAYLTINAVNLSAEPSLGVKVVDAALTSGDIFNATEGRASDLAAIDLTINDIASSTKLVYSTDGLYVAVASVTKDNSTKYYTTLADAAVAALAANVQNFSRIHNGAATTLAGWTYDSTTGKFTKNANVAAVGGTEYATLGEAVTAAVSGNVKTVDLLANVSDAVSVDSEITLNLNGYTTGTITGSGTVTASSQPATNAEPTFGEGWTGTFVVNWSVPSTQKGFNFNKYGRAGSTVEIAQPWNNYQLNDDLTVNPAVKLSASMTMSNGYSGTGNCTTFSGVVSGTGNISFEVYNVNGSFYYEITKLDNYTGKITLKNGAVYGGELKYSYLTIGAVNLSAEPSVGVKVVDAALTSSGDIFNASGASVKEGAAIPLTVNGVESGNKLAYSTDGLYVAVATVTVDNHATYYTTLSDAASAAIAAGTTEFKRIHADAGTTLAGWTYDSTTETFTKIPSYVVSGVTDSLLVPDEFFPSATDTPEERNTYLATPQANGIAAWQNYAMGVNGTAAGNTLAPVAMEPTNATTLKIGPAFGSATPPSGSGVTVSYQLWKKVGSGSWTSASASQSTPNFDVDVPTLESEAYFKITATFVGE